MPLLPRRILLTAAPDGLHLAAYPTSRNSSGIPNNIKLEYGSSRPSSHASENLRSTTNASTALENILDAEHPKAEVHGIVGILTLSPTSSFLIAITARDQVAKIKDAHAIYVVTDVALIPLGTRKEAAAALCKIRSSPTTAAAAAAASDTEDPLTDDEDPLPHAQLPHDAPRIGEDVISKRGAYGRFAERWFSKRGWAVDRRRSEGMSAVPVATGVVDGPVDSVNEEVVEDAEEKVRQTEVTHSLTPKLLHTTRLLLGRSKSFYFSYEWDVTRSWARQTGEGSTVPLWKRVEQEFFWNRHLQCPFIEAGLTGFVMPLMQGFVGQTILSVPRAPNERSKESKQKSENIAVLAEEPAPEPATEPEASSQENVTITIISRRSTYRAGLRYLRRGIDESGHTANTVETEQLVSTPQWARVFSYLQIRGSIPLFFSQSPYSLRPRPVLQLSDEANTAAMRTHFRQLQDRYAGETHVVNLVEMQGNEAVVGNRFRDLVAGLNSKGEGPRVGWTWFDFHAECRGMRFENVERLFSQIAPDLARISYSTFPSTSGDSRQLGVLRTNCMDCLDRTNVVQSFAARLALKQQLQSLDLGVPATEMAFNALWADNGDAVSQQYASTAALKGDFTRTRTRNLQGALTDLSLSVTRYFSNLIADFFSQAAIDFLLGTVTTRVFADFEATMATSDPAISLVRARENALETAAKIVVADEAEVLRGGWTLLAPRAPDAARGPPLAEKLILLTDAALYLCAYDWALEKVEAFERVPVEDVVAVHAGAYHTSTLGAAATDPARNVGLLVEFSATRDMLRVNTRSLQTTPSTAVATGAGRRFWALKAIGGATRANESEAEVVERVCRELVAVCENVRDVVREDVVSLEEARKGTGIVERWGHAVKKLVWA